MAKFLNDIELTEGNNIQFSTTAGANAGKIEQDGNNLVLSNAVGDILLGDGSSDVYIGDGTNSVDIVFEQSGAIKGDGSALTLTLGGSGTTLNLENPNLNGTISLGVTNISNILTLAGSSSKIVFDYEAAQTGEYTTEVPLLQVDRAGSPITILSRTSSGGAIVLGADDMVHIAAGDTKTIVKDNRNMSEEQVVLSSEMGFIAYGFPSNDVTWANRNEFRFRADSGTASENGLYIGDGGSTQFIDVSRNLSVGTISSGAITSTGKVTGTELEGTSLDINGDADISGNLVIGGTVDGIDIATDVAANTAKTGITSGQASAITANTAKETNVVQTTVTGNAGTVTNGVYTTGDQSISGKKSFTGPTKIEQTWIYDMSAGSLDTTGYACAGLSSSSNGQSATFVFECGGSSGNSYQRIVYNCWNANGTWNTSKNVDEGGNTLDVTASANGSTITFTFKSRSGTQSYTPRVHVQAMGTGIVTTY